MNKTQNNHIQFYTKIQQAYPSNLSTLPNKEVGYFVHIELQKLYKLKNCIDSARTNSQLYKKFSKKLSYNIKNHINQMVICCGLEQQARMETSLGLKKNPGIFMIIGISILDEKYQNDHKNFDVEISFVQSRDGKFYDLLSYTKQPLKVSKKSQNYHMNESYFKITTFAQFLKLFKIALFNNKERDFKTSQHNFSKDIKSSLIMSIVTHTYRNGKHMQQKSVFIDFSKQQTDFGQKCEWQYFMIQLNNQTSRKKQHYHLVQPNPLIKLINQNFRNGQTYILNSLSTNSQKFSKNYEFLIELQNLVSQVQPRTQQMVTHNYQSIEQTMKDQISQNCNKIIYDISYKKYNSLRQYREYKQQISDMLQKSKEWNKSAMKILAKTLQNKRKIKIMEHCLVSDQLRLIGSCVKTEHYKDFYQAKSYLSLQRQISIKTENTIKQLLQLNRERDKIKQSFHQKRAKNLEFLDKLFYQKENLMLKTKTKFKKTIQTNATNIQKYLLKRIADYHFKLYCQITQTNSRTISDEILRQQYLSKSIDQMNCEIDKTIDSLNNLAKQGKIDIELEGGLRNAHLNLLIRQVKGLVLKSNKKSRQNYQKNWSKTNLKVTSPSTNISTKFTKLPSIDSQKICIAGQLSLKQLLLDPNS